MAGFQVNSIKLKAAAWMRQGISARRLALTLALGIAVGCIPMVGLPTAICVVLAFVLKLNLPAIQAANYAALPLQVVLAAPLVKLGGWLVSFGPNQTANLRVLLHITPASMLWNITGFAGQALLAWAVTAIPAVALLTLTLTLLLRRVPALAATKPAGEPAS